MNKNLFGEEEFNSPRTHRRGGSSSPIVFKDYASFVAKFKETRKTTRKTTDDCYTPEPVYRAVLDYVRSIADIEGKPILRPFFPGGDYTRLEEYPPDGVVVDNPPFSILSKIVKFYTREQVPFFLFANGMTVFGLTDYACAVVVNSPMVAENGAEVGINFLTNLLPNERARTAPELSEALRRLVPAKEAKLTAYAEPACSLSVSDMQKMAREGIDFRVPRGESLTVSNLGGVRSFGSRLLLSERMTERAKVERAKAERAKTERAIERAKTEGAKTEGAKTERAIERAKTEGAKTEGAKTERAKVLLSLSPEQERARAALASDKNEQKVRYGSEQA